MDASSIALAVCSLVLSVCSLFGNTLVCLAIIMNKNMRTPLNFLLFSLAVSDALTGVLSAPGNAIFNLIDQPEIPQVLCRLFANGNIVVPCSIVSAFSLEAISYERYQAIVYPLTARTKITKSGTCKFVFSWFCSILCASPAYFSYDFKNETERQGKCDGLEPANGLMFMVSSYILGILSCICPCVAMVGCYGRALWKFIKTNDQMIDQHQLAVSRAKKRVTFMLVTVTTISTILWSVAFYKVVLYHNGKAVSFTSSLVVLLILCNSSINWLLYAVFSEQFRKCFKRLLCCCWKTARVGNKGVQGLGSSPQVECKSKRHCGAVDTKL